MEIKKILWAFDGSKESEEALNYAIYLGQILGSEIIGIHVIPLPEKLLYETEFHNWAVKVEERIKSRLVSIGEQLDSQGLRFRSQVLRGEPSKEIFELAEREKANLIVMGKRGQGLIDRMLTGSTALSVLRESSIPILTVKKRDEETPIEIKNILVPLDISEGLDSSLNCAVELGERLKANIMVVYVFSLYAYEYEVPYWVFDDLIKISTEKLTKKVEEIKLRLGNKAGEIAFKTEVIQGLNTAISIVDYALRVNTDLIVMNTHGRKGIKKFILGSVTEKVVQEAHCPVLVLKP
ncbi:MAG TPA: universal stress protein [Thermodesulfobacteriota bacterium]|nr:universal stress protein [Thermodesulfobacteriota bacterium]